MGVELAKPDGVRRSQYDIDHHRVAAAADVSDHQTDGK